jgi:hypothetical protein
VLVELVAEETLVVMVEQLTVQPIWAAVAVVRLLVVLVGMVEVV